MIAALPTRQAAAAATFDRPARYCAAVGTIDAPDGRYTGPAVPDWIARALKRATNAPASAPLDMFKHAAWRCENGHVMACSIGANIPCDSKADVSRTPNTGEVNFCRDNPGAAVVPAFAAGSATVFEWRCQGTQPVITRQVLTVDDRGFPAAFWHQVAPTSP